MKKNIIKATSVLAAVFVMSTNAYASMQGASGFSTGTGTGSNSTMSPFSVQDYSGINTNGGTTGQNSPYSSSGTDNATGIYNTNTDTNGNYNTNGGTTGQNSPYSSSGTDNASGIYNANTNTSGNYNTNGTNNTNNASNSNSSYGTGNYGSIYNSNNTNSVSGMDSINGTNTPQTMYQNQGGMSIPQNYLQQNNLSDFYQPYAQNSQQRISIGSGTYLTQSGNELWLEIGNIKARLSSLIYEDPMIAFIRNLQSSIQGTMQQGTYSNAGNLNTNVQDDKNFLPQ
ncbi:MAG: hypothetical protein LBM16_02650 [Clostridiales bacterium]|jgi:hypothetical protein|nr:hypothetical protein [Clostridiales bacterium]